MSAIDTLFQELRASGRKALMPFVTAGYPDVDFTAALLQEFSDRGCSMCEVGVPYSDPIADGPVIQASYTRALEQGITVADIFAMAKKLTTRPTAPLVTMVSYAIVYRHGVKRFVEDAKAAGFAGVIVPDLLVEEAREAVEICRAADFSLIHLITPTTPHDRAAKIAASSSGFLYYVSVTGITGERNELPDDLIDNVTWLRKQTSLPICIGFGINTPEHVRQLAPVADGLIVGSAIVRRIAEASPLPREKHITQIGDYVSTLLDAFEN